MPGYCKTVANYYYIYYTKVQKWQIHFPLLLLAAYQYIVFPIQDFQTLASFLMFSSISSLNFLMELQRNTLTHLSKLNLSSTCTSKQYMPTQHKSNRAGSCTTSEVQLKVNHRPKVHHRIRIWAGSANSWKNSISLNSILQFTFMSNSLVHGLSPYIHTGVKVLRQRQRAAFPLYEKCNV